MSKALLLIDIQNDYFEGGGFPLWGTSAVLESVERAAKAASEAGIPIVHIQHIADPSQGPAPFFNEGTEGADIHPRMLAAAPDAKVIRKSFADAFEQTELATTLEALGVNELLVAGMMTQNCVTHTAISKAAEAYDVKVLVDCCTTVDEMLHQIALHALSTRVTLVPASDALS